MSEREQIGDIEYVRMDIGLVIDGSEISMEREECEGLVWWVWGGWVVGVVIDFVVIVRSSGYVYPREMSILSWRACVMVDCDVQNLENSPHGVGFLLKFWYTLYI